MDKYRLKYTVGLVQYHESINLFVHRSITTLPKNFSTLIVFSHLT